MAWASMGTRRNAMENIGFFRFQSFYGNPDMNINKGLAGAPDRQS
jgi:hypothetical protein